MSLKDYVIDGRDNFESHDEKFGYAFPCSVCTHRFGTDRDEPCVSCDHNANAKPNSSEGKS